MTFTAQLPLHGPNRDLFIERMGTITGFEFHFLWQESRRLAQLHDELAVLIGQPHTVRLTLDQELSGFYRMVCDAWWRDLVLGVCAITETTTFANTRSIGLPEWCKRHVADDSVPWVVSLKNELESLSKVAKAIRVFRNKFVAHADRERTFNADREGVELAVLTEALVHVANSIRHIEDGYGLTHWSIEPVYGGAQSFVSMALLKNK